MKLQPHPTKEKWNQKTGIIQAHHLVEQVPTQSHQEQNVNVPSSTL